MSSPHIPFPVCARADEVPDKIGRQSVLLPEPSRQNGSKVLMMDVKTQVLGDLLLHNADYPSNFINMQHPQDYISAEEPVSECIYHTNDGHARMIARISWRKSDNEFIPMSFIIDTGAPTGLYLSPQARAVLDSINRIKVDDLNGITYVSISNIGLAVVEHIPAQHVPGNIMGLRLLRRIGLIFDHQTGNFSFPNAPRAW